MVTQRTGRTYLGAETFDDTAVETRPIAGSKLMHNKYIIIDAHTSKARVFTGSTNFTADAWTHQENNILIISPSPELAAYYETDFQELWTNENIGSTGVNDTGRVSVGGATIDVELLPERGPIVQPLKRGDKTYT